MINFLSSTKQYHLGKVLWILVLLLIQENIETCEKKSDEDKSLTKLCKIPR